MSDKSVFELKRTGAVAIAAGIVLTLSSLPEGAIYKVLVLLIATLGCVSLELGYAQGSGRRVRRDAFYAGAGLASVVCLIMILLSGSGGGGPGRSRLSSPPPSNRPTPARPGYGVMEPGDLVHAYADAD